MMGLWDSRLGKAALPGTVANLKFAANPDQAPWTNFPDDGNKHYMYRPRER
jgi:hypothetical protein